MENKPFKNPNPVDAVFTEHSFTDGAMYKHILNKYRSEPDVYLKFLKDIMLNRVLQDINIVNTEQLDNYNVITDRWGTEYKINSHGLRSKPFEDIKDKPVIVAIGCSITHGTGLDPEEIWIHKLAERLDCEYVNLSMPGCSTSITSMYCAEYVLKQFTNVKAIFQYTPPPNRVDLLAYTELDEAQYPLHKQDVTTHSLLSLVETDYTSTTSNIIIKGLEHTAFLNYTKDELLLDYASKLYNVPYIVLDSEQFRESQWQRWSLYGQHKARDKQHDGELLHTDIADTFYLKFTDK